MFMNQHNEGPLPLFAIRSRILRNYLSVGKHIRTKGASHNEGMEKQFELGVGVVQPVRGWEGRRKRYVQFASQFRFIVR